jgi:hypothetical protein
MSRSLRTSIALAAAVGGVAAMAPAAAHADADLMGAPTLRVLNADKVGLQIAVDEKLRTKDGAVRARVTVGDKRLGALSPSGRHGRDFLYAGSMARAGLEVGQTYTVRISIPGQDTVVRKVKLHPRRA